MAALGPRQHINVRQRIIIEKMNLWLEKMGRDNSSFLSSGQCSGLTGVWGLYEAEGRGAWFTKSLEEIATWDGHLDHIDSNFMENFINSVKSLHDPRTLLALGIEQADYDKIVAVLGGLGGAFSRKAHRVDFVFKLDELSDIIEKTIIANKKFVRVGSTDHAVGVMLIDNHYWLYDPSDEQGRAPQLVSSKGKSGAQVLAQALQNLFLTKWNVVQTAKIFGKPGDENIPISMHTFDMPNSDEVRFPDTTILIADIIESRIRSGQPVNLGLWDNKDALWVLARRGSPHEIRMLLKAMDQHLEPKHSSNVALRVAIQCKRENGVILAFYPEYEIALENVRKKTLNDYKGGIFALTESERQYNVLALQMHHLTEEIDLFNSFKTRIQAETGHVLQGGNAEEKLNALLISMDELAQKNALDAALSPLPMDSAGAVVWSAAAAENAEQHQQRMKRKMLSEAQDSKTSSKSAKF